MKRHDIVRIIQAKYDRYARQVISQIKALPSECRQSGDDSPLKDVWEEFKDQLQNEQSVVFDAYEDTIRQICRGIVGDMPEDEQQLLWHWSETYFNGDEDTAPNGDRLATSVLDELYTRVCSIATDEPLESEKEVESEQGDEAKSNSLGCPRCQATPTDFKDLPFEQVATIVDHSHESVDLVRCKHCGQLFGKYDLEILLDDGDDQWSYWVPVTAAEAEALQAPDGASQIIDFIKSRRRLVCGPSAKFHWNEGDFETGIDLTPPG